MFVLVCLLPMALLLVVLGFLAMSLGSNAILPLACRTLSDDERRARLSTIARRVKAERLAAADAPARGAMSDKERAARLSEIAQRVKAERTLVGSTSIPTEI